MQSFLGAANFFHTYIPNYATWASSLYECTTAAFNWDPTTWTKDYKALFEVFKTAIQDSATLHFPDYSLPWVIRSDSSDNAVGAVLFQLYTNSTGNIIHQAIAFASKKYSDAAINWDTYKQEAYALYFAVFQFGYYLRGKPRKWSSQPCLDWIKPSLHHRTLARPTTKLCLPSPTYPWHRKTQLLIGYYACVPCIHQLYNL